MAAFTYRFPVRVADVDHAGLVYYPRFFHYFHVAFEELWRARVGARAYRDLLDGDRVGFPAVRAECDFKAPLRFGDEAEVELSIARMGESSIAFRYVVRNVTDGAPTMGADGRVVCAVVDLARFVAVPVPARLTEILADLVQA